MSTRNSVFPKKYIAFFGITGIILVTTFIKVPCPVCDGTGIISTAVGMENVFLSGLQTDLKYSNPDFCMGYTLYEYDIDMTLTNSGAEKAMGWIKLVLKNTYKGDTLDTKYVPVEIPREATVGSSFTTWFTTAYDVSQDVTVDATVEFGGVKDLTCSGTGSLPLNVWFMAKAIKSSLLRAVMVEQQFKPPPYEIPPQFDWD
ncbi:MAG: hypothetical protein C4542_08830 [Dehalococcoidia bacterium]|nr:MAG: hypothetical protein C4542_08830 [Dehalococcoidia bacterium]